MFIIPVYFILVFALCYFLTSKFVINFYLTIKVFFRAPKNAEILLSQLQKLQGMNNVSLQQRDFCEFKFYTNLLKSFIGFAREFGQPMNDVLRDLISALYAEIKFSKSLRSSILSTLVQFFMISLLTWLFINLLKSMVGIEVSWNVILNVIMLEFSGVILFLVITYFIYLKILADFDQVIFTLYTMKGLSKVGLPISKILKLSEFEKFPNSQRFNFIHRRLVEITKQAVSQGVPINNSVQQIIDDIWPTQKHQFELFSQILNVAKFAFMAIFFLPSYFLVIFDLIKNLGI